MANRYISSSERAKAIGEGIALVASIMDRPPRRDDPELATYKAWVETWGDKMKEFVEKVHYDNMTWAINYRD